ncbi:MAG: phosphatidylserine decarboxylase [Cytophagales bacterium]|nr:phosphatidylserine decarboxylase [Cytophagales bacterium]
MKGIQYIDRKTGKLISENPPGEGYLKFLYHNPFGKLALNLLVKRKFLSSWYGKKMANPKSAEKVDEFVKNYHIKMEDYQVPEGGYTSFNDFFYRKLKEGARTIEEGFVSPADGKLLAFEKVEDLKEFFVKGNNFTLAKYLQDDKLTEQFKNASLLLIRLAPNDYHRFHFPMSGKISSSKLINGDYFSVSPYAVKENFTIFCENKREYSILSTEDKGDVLISEIGATMVGTIGQTYKADSFINKGDEKGYFAFGGSSVILLVDSDKLTIDKDILENTRNGMETAVLMGEKIGE